MKIITVILFWLGVLSIIIGIIIRLFHVAGWPPGFTISPASYLHFGVVLFVASIAWHFTHGGK